MGIENQITVLVIEDSESMRKVICGFVEGEGHIALEADGHIEAFEQLEANTVQLILMDIEMPVVNGIELTKQIRKRYERWIPIIFLSGNDRDKFLTQGIEAGGDDYLTKPVKPTILHAKINAMVRIATMQRELNLLNQKLEKLTLQDPLTKVMNRRALDKKLKEDWYTCQRINQPLSVLMIDIDHFKSYNDHYGHAQGDNCLKKVALSLKQNINRETDSIARYGGEEFTVLLPFTCLEHAEIKAKQLARLLEERSIEHIKSPTAKVVTISIGIACTSQEITSYKELINNADSALYQSKVNGRNQTCIYEQSIRKIS
ncbi:diguanylate cyclase [Thalassotalea sp. LPB0316]|uniref:GGDEF domain-containing protein n=1 Tax=Thalassotalea sp. LPB0316 TaxID=2769490 RepID=UPI001868F2BA|nr:diguanylate cyclase [Thalassotalea sp. LPB0316]QOL24779.1 diguanylate cyclase [Thalassotalea sp. LPB0316]